MDDTSLIQSSENDKKRCPSRKSLRICNMDKLTTKAVTSDKVEQRHINPSEITDNIDIQNIKIEVNKTPSRKSLRLIDKENSTIKPEPEMSFDKHDEDLLQLMFKSVNNFKFEEDSDDEDVFKQDKEDQEAKVRSQKAHMALVSDEGILQCNVCQKRFPDRNSLRSHILEELRHEVDDKLGSSMAGEESVVSPNKFDRKIQEIMKDLLVCDICSRRFMTQGQLRVHKQDHERNKIVTCGVCLRNFMSKQQLEEHIEGHLWPIRCDPCQVHFRSHEAKRRHIRTDHLHLTPRRYECKLCGVVVTNIFAHMAVHAREDSVCKLCRRHFSVPLDYRQHRHKCEVYLETRSMEVVRFDVACGLDEAGLCVHQDKDLARVNVVINSKGCQTTDWKYQSDITEDNGSKRRRME